MRTLIDANIVLRYILGDDSVQSAEAKAIVDEGAVLLPEVMCEAAYVLEGVYAVNRRDVCGYLTTFINEVECPDGDVLKTALSIYASQNKLDLVDSILVARHQVDGDEVRTFDRKLQNRIKRIDGRL